MTAILRNIQLAWLGWKNYTDDGKLAALLLAAMFFLWYHRKKTEKASFLGYTIVVTICCIFPVTAGLLMVYQTQFYDYEWIWSLVPVTAAIAYGVTFLLSECWNSAAEGRGDLKERQEGFQMAQWRRGIPVTVLLLAVILLSGGMGSPSWDRKGQAAEREQAYVILDQIMDLCPEGEICLWAPKEIMAYARERDGRIRLPYGRNMWDIALNAYAYDVYDEQTIALYEWMEQAGKADTMDAYLSGAMDTMTANTSGAKDTMDAMTADTSGTRATMDAMTADTSGTKGTMDAMTADISGTRATMATMTADISGTRATMDAMTADTNGTKGTMDVIGSDTASRTLEICIQYARDAGVDCVVLPETVSQETIQKMETALHTEARLVEEYWIFYERAD